MPYGGVGSIVVFDDCLLEPEVFLFGDDLLLTSAVEVGELLADAGFVFTADLGATEAAGDGAGNGDEGDAGEEGSEVHFAKFQMAVATLVEVASSVSNFW